MLAISITIYISTNLTAAAAGEHRLAQADVFGRPVLDTPALPLRRHTSPTVYKIGTATSDKSLQNLEHIFFPHLESCPELGLSRAGEGLIFGEVSIGKQLTLKRNGRLCSRGDEVRPNTTQLGRLTFAKTRHWLIVKGCCFQPGSLTSCCQQIHMRPVSVMNVLYDVEGSGLRLLPGSLQSESCPSAVRREVLFPHTQSSVHVLYETQADFDADGCVILYDCCCRQSA